MDFETSVKSTLKELGLTEVQSSFYIKILKSGGISVSKAAKELGINRTNTYNIVDKLKSMELIWEEKKVGGKVLHAKSHEQLIKLLEEKENSLNEKKRFVMDSIPLFKSFGGISANAPKIKLYESKKGLSEMMDDILDSTNKEKGIFLFTNQDSEKRFFSRAGHDEFIKRRINAGIPIRVLAVKNIDGELLKEMDEHSLRETRFLPPEFSFQAELYIYENKISMINVEEEIIGVIIENEELYKIHKQIFEYMWNLSK